MPSPERVTGWFPRITLALLVVASVGGLLFQLTLGGREARDEDYVAAAAVLAQESRPGDVVLLAPWWTERARLFLPSGLPVVGYLRSDGDDLEAHPRVWVLAEPHLPRAQIHDFEKAFEPGRTLDGAVRTFGRLTLARYTNGRYRPAAFEALAALPAAIVYVETVDGQRQPCRWEGTRFQCPGGLHVGAEWHELLFAPRRCLWMHPPGGPARLVAEFPDVPAQGSLVLEGGIVWEHAPRRDVTPLEVGADDSQGLALTLAVPGGLEGMQRRELLQHGGAPRAVRLWTRSERGEAREACVDLRVLGARKDHP